MLRAVCAAFDEHHDFVAHGDQVNDFSFAFGCGHALVAFWESLARFNILFVFVDEAATQASAHARDLVGRERDALLLCHLDRDGREVR